MSDKKNIERLFQEKFKDFEVVPPPKVWDNIEAALHKKKKRKVIPIWFRLSGVAALLLVGLFISYNVWNESDINKPHNGVVNQENNKPENDNGKNLVPTKNPVQNNQVVTETSNSINSGQDSNSSVVSSEVNYTKNNTVSNQEASENSTIYNPISPSQKTKNTVSNKSFKNTAIAHSIKTDESNRKASDNRKPNDNLISKATNTSVAISDQTSKENKKKATIAATIEIEKDNAIAGQNNQKPVKNKSGAVLENKNIDNNSLILNDKIASEKEINKNKTRIAFEENAIEKLEKDSTAVATVVPNPLEELLLQQEKEKQAVTETKVNRWQITSNVAPIYFSSASNGSPISQEFADNSKDYEKNMSYGVGVNYALSNKWSVRGGVNKLTLGYNTNDIVYYAGLDGEAARGANTYAAKGSPIIIEDNTAANIVSFDNVPGKRPGHLNQTMGYIEVPVELSYKLLDRKFGIEIIGGMSTMFLNENNLSVVSNGMAVSVGEADNLNDVSFTSNIGLGFKYKFWKSFQANIEPKFKYQLNTFSENDGGFKPYFIGIYSGLSFSF